MNRLVWGGCAISALALAYAAHASNGSEQTYVTLSGTVPPICNIAKIAGGASNAFVTNTGFDYTVDFSPAGGTNSFANSQGVGATDLSGSFVITLSSNATCTYTLTSQNGTLWNSDANALRTYSADVYPFIGGTKSMQQLNQHGTTVLRSLPIAPGSTAVLELDFEIPPSAGIMAAGTYTDTLTLKLTPPH